MKRIDVLIWKYMMDDLGEYVSSVDMCRELGLSRRQLLTRITKLHYPHVTKMESADRMTYFKIDCEPSEAQACTVQLLSKYYGCPVTTIDNLLMAIPEDHSITLDEVDLTGQQFSMKDFINIVGMMPCIEVTKTWSRNRYRRISDV